MLSKLRKVELRQAWKNEATDFTNWLALDENLQLLSDEIGIDISLIQTEASVGRFSVDILAEEENARILVEDVEACASLLTSGIIVGDCFLAIVN